MNDREFYEKFWAGYSTDLRSQLSIHRESRRPLHRLLAQYLPGKGPARVLEVGCGTALDCCLLAQARAGIEAVALDLSQRAISIAQRNAAQLGLPVRTLAADLTALPFPGASFDLVFSQGVLEHFTDPFPAVREQARVLRDGGVLVVDVPQKYNLYTLEKRRAMRAGRWSWGWETEYSVRELRGWGQQIPLEPMGAVGHQHGRILDRLVIHPHRTLHNKLTRWRGMPANGYQPGALARAWESLWDWVDARLGPYAAINVAVAFRKPVNPTRTRVRPQT